MIESNGYNISYNRGDEYDAEMGNSVDDALDALSEDGGGGSADELPPDLGGRRLRGVLKEKDKEKDEIIERNKIISRA